MASEKRRNGFCREWEFEVWVDWLRTLYILDRRFSAHVYTYLRFILYHHHIVIIIIIVTRKRTGHIGPFIWTVIAGASSALNKCNYACVGQMIYFQANSFLLFWTVYKHTAVIVPIASTRDNASSRLPQESIHKWLSSCKPEEIDTFALMCVIDIRYAVCGAHNEMWTKCWYIRDVKVN